MDDTPEKPVKMRPGAHTYWCLKRATGLEPGKPHRPAGSIIGEVIADASIDAHYLADAIRLGKVGLCQPYAEGEEA